jgi:chemotaxis protein methyltransferase CheR
MELQDIENIELDLLLQAIYQRYGYDFRNYTRASIRRRVTHSMQQSGLNTVSEVQRRLLYDEHFFQSLFLDLSVNVTEMFRDPAFYRALRTHVIPELKKLPFLKIWHAGCSSGEEVYSLAIVLKEEGLYERAQIYATDINEVILQTARQGIFPINRLQQYTQNYQKSGGREAFSNYYAAHYAHVVMDKSIKENVLFSDHNLATDGVFGEMNLIICRNVLIYFNRALQNRVFGLFYDSLSDEGFLALGSKESVRFCDYSAHFIDIERDMRIYRKQSQPKTP